MMLGPGSKAEMKRAEAEADAIIEQAKARNRDTVMELDGTVKVQGEVSSVSERDAAETVEAVTVEAVVEEPGSSRSKMDIEAQLDKFAAKMPRDEHEQAAAKELYDEMSEDYKRYIKEKVAALPIVRYHRRAPFTEDEKKIIAAGLMSRQPHYKIAQILRCSYAKIDKAILDDEFLTELAREAVLREKEEIEEGIDDCIKARNPAVIMWKAAKIMPEKYGEQVNLDNEDDTRLVIGAIPDADLEEAEQIIGEMKDKVPVIPTPALIEANEIQAEREAAGFGVSSLPLAETPATPAVNPPPGDPRFRPLVSAGEQNQVDENGRIVSSGMRPGGMNAPEPDPGPDNYTVFNDDIGEFGGGSWI